MNLNIYEEVDLSINNCFSCQNPLCIRESVINLALGNEDKMHCIFCLAKIENVSAEVLLKQIYNYVKRRDCLNNEWKKYKVKANCPNLLNCLPDVCFSI